jgi:hypothetical protein
MKGGGLHTHLRLLKPPQQPAHAEMRPQHAKPTTITSRKTVSTENSAGPQSRTTHVVSQVSDTLACRGRKPLTEQGVTAAVFLGGGGYSS